MLPQNAPFATVSRGSGYSIEERSVLTRYIANRGCAANTPVQKRKNALQKVILLISLFILTCQIIS